MSNSIDQNEAQLLLLMEKIKLDDTRYDFPLRNTVHSIDLESRDTREKFRLVLRTNKIEISKLNYANLARVSIMLARLDLGASSPHRNPDDEDIIGPHIHLYREGYYDKWAIPLPTSRWVGKQTPPAFSEDWDAVMLSLEIFNDLTDYFATLQHFLQFCSIVEPPQFRRGLF